MRPDRGFTLIELVTAIAIGGVVVVSAAAIFSGSADTISTLDKRRAVIDRQANARLLLTEIVGAVDPISPGAQPFKGARGQIEFSAWTNRADGWPSLKRFTLEIGDSGLILSGLAHPLTLLPGARTLAVDYLAHAGANEAWVREWISPTFLPAAVRLRVATDGVIDTLLVALGARQ